MYLKNTGWSLNVASSCERLWSSPLSISTESTLPFWLDCLCNEKEMTGFGSLKPLWCLGKIHVTSGPGGFLTANKIIDIKTNSHYFYIAVFKLIIYLYNSYNLF